MDKILIARYEMLVFSTGQVEIHPITEDTGYGKCSSSIRQIIMIIEAVMEYYENNPNRHIHFAVTTAVNSVAHAEDVSQPTVYTKITRKLGLSMRDFKDMLKTCLDSNAPDEDEFVKVLLAACVNRTKTADMLAVNSVIAKIRGRSSAPSQPGQA